MTLAADTDALLNTSIWGEQIEIIRNDPGYGQKGYGHDFFMVVATPNADIQRVAGNNPTRNLGQGRFMTHQIFLPDGTDIRQGDRIHPSGWSIGQAEYFVEVVLSDEGHVEARTKIVRSAAGIMNYLLLEDGSYFLLENKTGMFLEN